MSDQSSQAKLTVDEDEDGYADFDFSCPISDSFEIEIHCSTNVRDAEEHYIRETDVSTKMKCSNGILTLHAGLCDDDALGVVVTDGEQRYEASVTWATETDEREVDGTDNVEVEHYVPDDEDEEEGARN